MITATRKITSKEIQQDADQYVGEYGEVWFQEGTTTLRFGDAETPGGVPLGGGGTAGPETTCAPGVTTVIYTATTASARTIKMTAQAIGFETGVVDFEDTHSADVIAVKNLRTGLGEASVYGVTYTSNNPLVTFDAQITAGVLQITAQPTSLTNVVTVKTIAIEIEA